MEKQCCVMMIGLLLALGILGLTSKVDKLGDLGHITALLSPVCNRNSNPEAIQKKTVTHINDAVQCIYLGILDFRSE